MFDLSFYKNKKVFVTGHTGFKGSWLCRILIDAGAQVTGYALEPNEENVLFELSDISEKMNSIIGDIRDYQFLYDSIHKTKPEIVFHLAAQPLVKESYNNPKYTYDVNVMGTVNICEAIRLCESVKSFVNVTTDKVYKNNEWNWGYREYETLDGFDPYSNSKSCSELVTNCYKNSYFNNLDLSVSTVRAGNVIGGGDFAIDRIIPDCIRSAVKGEKIIVRNPNSIRPFQHVLEALGAYLIIARKQIENRELQGNYNIGPDEADCITVGNLVNIFCEKWGENLSWECITEENAHHEANYLKLDCSKVKSVFDWKPKWDINMAVEKTVEWAKVYFSLLNSVKKETNDTKITKEYKDKVSMAETMQKQINEYFE